MAGAAKKWFIGCGIGCGLFLLIVVGIGTVSYLGIKEAVDGGESIDASFQELDARFGQPAEYVPTPDGSVPTDRMMVFLSVREAMAPERKEAGDILRTLDGQEVDGQSPNFLDKAKAGMELIPGMMKFVGQRNQALLEQGMGLGEYVYIYSLAYYNLLGKEMADGPGFTLSDDGGEDHDGFRWSTSEGNSEDTRADREKRVRRYLHGMQLSMARNQLAALDSLGDEVGIRDQLEAEIARMESESLRILWETEMPTALRLSLETYRTQLEATYDEMVNALEASLIDHE